MHKFSEYRDAQSQAEKLAEIVAGQLRSILAEKESATLAVPGGTTPEAFLCSLSRIKLDWKKIHVVLTDERFVPEESDRSNARLLKHSLLKNEAAEAQFIPLLSNEETPENAATSLCETVRNLLPLDVCVLGMGADMHVASLFPGADDLDRALAEDCSDLVMAMRSDAVPEARLTLTAPALLSARHLHLLIKGEEKRHALENAKKAETSSVSPVKLLLGRDNLTIHYTDGASK